MFESVYRALGTFLWRLFIGVVVLLAIVVSLTTALVPLLPAVNNSLVNEIEARTGFEAQVLGVTAEMEGFRPRLALDGLNIRNKATSASVFRAGRLQITLNPWRSLLQRQLILAEMWASDVAIPARLSNASNVIVVPIDPGVFATEIERMALENMRVSLAREASEAEQTLDLIVDLDLRREGSRRKLQLLATGDGGLAASVVGAGVGNPLDLSRFTGSLQGRLSSDDMGSISDFFDVGLAGTSDLLFWTEAADGRASTLFEATGDALVQSSDRRSPRLAFSVNGIATLDTDEYWVNVVNANFSFGEEPFQFKDIHLGFTTTDWRLHVNDLDIASSAKFLLEAGLIPPQVRAPLKVASVSGTVNALSARGSLVGELFQQVAVDFDDIAVKENSPLPGIRGLSGSLMLEGKSGQLQVKSQDLKLAIPTQYPVPLDLGTVNAIIDFESTKNQLVIRNGRAKARANDFEAMALLTGEIPLSSESVESPKLNVILGSASAPTSRILQFTPSTIDADAYNWMQASLGTGSAADVGFILRGGVRKRDIPLRSVQLSALADLDGVTMMPDLPLAESLKGYVAIDNGLVTFDVDSGLVGGLDISDGLVQVGKQGSRRILSALATIEGALPAAAQQVASLPYVPKQVRDELSALDLEGEIRGDFDLSIPIKGAKKIPEITTRVELVSAQVGHHDIPIRLKKVKGDFWYEYPRGITKGELKARFSEQDIVLDLDLDSVDLGLKQKGLSISTDIRLGVAEVNELAGLSIPNSLIAGDALFEITFQAGEGIALTAVSSLSGLGLTLPAPFDKERGQSAALQVDVTLLDTLSVDLSYGRDIAVSATRDKLNQWTGLVSIGETVERPAFDELDVGTLEIEGSVPVLDISAWLSAGASFNSDGATFLPKIRWQDFTIDSLLFNGQNLGAFSSSGQHQNNVTSLELSSDFVDAQIDFVSPEKKLGIQIDSFVIDAMPQLDSSRQALFSADVASASWPAIQVGFDSIKLRGRDLGSLAFDVNVLKSNVNFSRFSGALDGVTLGSDTQFTWYTGDRSKSHVSLDLKLAAADEALTLIDAKSVVNFASGAVYGDIEWAGGPTDFEANQLGGDLTLQLTSGSFLPVPSQATDPLRFIGIFNLAGLVQRANVNQLFDPGLTFDRASGEFSLKGDTISISEFAIRNGGGSLTLGGDYRLDTENIDAELVVTLPLVDNIPWVAALAGGLPIAAGAYLASKVFEDQMTRLSSGVYSVTGPAASPEVKFVRVFDAGGSTQRETSEASNQSSADASDSERR
jgi:uncharacterized protein YhdP